MNGAVVDEILARTSSGGTTAWYLTDKLGSVRDIVSTSGTELDHIVYDSFGNIVTETNAANGDRFKFAGMEYDATIGQYYDHARWYGSGIGRFLNLDPLGIGGGDSDLYRYVANDALASLILQGLVFESPQAADKFLTDLAKLMNLTVPKLMANKDFKLLWDILNNSPKMIKLKIAKLRPVIIMGAAVQMIKRSGGYDPATNTLTINPEGPTANNPVEFFGTLVHGADSRCFRCGSDNRNSGPSRHP